MELTFIITILLFIFGASIGSFLSVLIYRHKNNVKGTINGRSMCPKCKHQLKEHDLIPLFSYISTKGKCRYCKKKIDRSYFYIELLTGFIFAFWGQLIPFYQNTYGLAKIEFLLTLTISAVLIAIFFYDLRYQEIPDSFSLTGIGLGIINILIFDLPSWNSVGLAVAIIFGFFGSQILISKGKWLGMGDLILGIFMSVILGWERLLLALALSYIIGATVAITLLATGKVTRKNHIPFAPFLITGTFISMMFGNIIISWYLSYLSF